MAAEHEITDVERRAADLLRGHRRQIYHRTDHMFAWLLVVQWLAAVVAAVWAAPKALLNDSAVLHQTVWFAILLGGLTCVLPVLLAWFRPGRRETRFCISIAQILFSSMLIHLSGDHAETHFHVFASLAFLAAYRDWRLLIAPTVFAVLDRLARGVFLPQFSFGLDATGPWGFLEYSAWLLFVDAFLMVSIRQSQREMHDSAEKTAELEESRLSSQRQTEELNRIFAKERAIIEGALDAVIAVDRNGLITTWNYQAERIFGWTSSEAIGQEFSELVIPESDRGKLEASLRSDSVIAGKIRNRRQECFGLHRSGRVFPMELSATPIRHGNEITFCAFVRDITDRKVSENALRNSESQARRLALVAAHTHNAVVITDARQRIEWVNEGFTRITEYTLDEVIGRRPAELLQGPGTDPDKIEFMRTRIAAAEAFQTEIQNYSKSGREYWLAIEVQPLRTAAGALSGFMAIESDITARKKAEQELLRAKEQAEAASQAKSAFLANMSHEIRTPLTGILGFTDVLRSGDVSSRQSQNYLNIIHSCGTHLLTLLNDILDLSKIEAGRMDFEKVRSSPQQIITDVLSVLRVRAKEKGLTLEAVWTTDVPETIETDPARLRQLLMNLIANAIKFTERGSVTVSVAARRTEADWRLEFEIRDTGIGIARDQLERIFLPFDQADNSITRTFGGTGRGLAISRHIAQGLGGDVTVDSQLGAGSSFTATISTGALEDVIFLPLQLSESFQPVVRSAPRSSGSADLTGVRILLVEDGETNRDLISLVLSRANALVTCACNGLEGAIAAETHEFDIILMDMQMPVMDGYSAAQRLRAGGCRAPIIALTAHAMRGDREKCLAAGCTGYLTKPIQIDRLLEAVAEQKTPHNGAPSLCPDDDVEWAADGVTIEPLGQITSTLPASLPKVGQIVERFVVALGERRERMHRAFNDDRWGDLAESAHWLKGAGGTVGFHCFTEPARRLEQAARRGQPHEAENCLREIDCLIDRIATPEIANVSQSGTVL